jgi:transposase
MSLQPQPIPPIPETTAEVARAAFPKGNVYMQMRDALGSIYSDDVFARLYPPDGQPSINPWRLALVTVMQFAENKTDRQAAEAVRGRIDWKYTLRLELTDPGFDYSVLSEFRQRLIAGGAERQLLETILEQRQAKDLLGSKKKQRTDSTHVLAAIRTLNLVELVGETMRRVLNDLAQVAPDWLQAQIQPGWVKRYGRPFDSHRLPKSKEKREALAKNIGQDGFTLLQAIDEADAPTVAKSLPRVELMRRIWLQQFYRQGDDVHWRTKKKWDQPQRIK